MLLSKITDLGARVAGAQDPAGPVVDAIVDLPERRIAYWRVDLGGRTAPAPLLVAARKTRLLPDGVQIDLPQDVIEAARSRVLARQQDAFDPLSMPDIVTGPFGHTVAPSMIAAAVSSWLRHRRPEPVPMPEGAPSGWIWASELGGKPVFGSGGEIGTVQDATIQGPEAVLTQISLRTPDGGDRALPAGVLRHVPGGASHLVAQVALDGSVRPLPPHQAGLAG